MTNPEAPVDRWAKVATGYGRLQGATRNINRMLALLAGVTVAALMFMTVADVTRRETVGGSLPGAIELTEVALVLIVFAGMPVAETARAHIRTPLLTGALPPRVASVLRLIGLVIVIAALAWIINLTAHAGYDSFVKREARYGIVRVPIWPAKLIIPIGFAGLLLEYVYGAVGNVRVVLGRQEAESAPAASGSEAVL